MRGLPSFVFATLECCLYCEEEKLVLDNLHESCNRMKEATFRIAERPDKWTEN